MSSLSGKVSFYYICIYFILFWDTTQHMEKALLRMRALGHVCFSMTAGLRAIFMNMLLLGRHFQLFILYKKKGKFLQFLDHLLIRSSYLLIRINISTGELRKSVISLPGSTSRLRRTGLWKSRRCSRLTAGVSIPGCPHHIRQRLPLGSAAGPTPHTAVLPESQRGAASNRHIRTGRESITGNQKLLTVACSWRLCCSGWGSVSFANGSSKHMLQTWPLS